MYSNEIKAIKDDITRLRELAYELRIRNLEKAVDKLLISGRATSNCCYNIGQAGGRVLAERDANSLWEAAKDWDTTVNEVRKLK